jgi:glycosyltransferase involved in cell wall biosynthesis
MRIAYLARSIVPSRDANSVHVMKACQAYARLGHRVTLWLPAWRGGVEPGVRDLHAFYGVEPSFAVRRVPVPSGRRLQAAWFSAGLPLLARLGRPALVHARSLTAAWGAARLLHMPTLFETHVPRPDNPRLGKLFDELAASRHLRGVVVITRALAALVAPDLPPSANLIVAPDGVDAAWLAGAFPRDEARRELGLDDETRPIAVYTGQLYEGRGVGLILDVARRRPDHLFVLVGGRSGDVERCRTQAAGLSNVLVAGFRPPAEIPAWMAAADALLMPYADRVATAGGGDSAAWASPMKMFEYLAAGRPILASTLPVLREVLADGTNALLLPYDRPDLWSEALARLAADPGLAAALAARARSDAEGYTWEERTGRLLAACGLPAEPRPHAAGAAAGSR